jgi:hypothetical protein
MQWAKAKMKTTGTTSFPKRIESCGWLLLLVMIAASLPFGSYRLTLGIAIGGLISALNFRMLNGNLARFLAGDMNRLKTAVVRKHYLRMAATAVLLFLIISNNITDVVGLLLGLSLIVIDITLTTVLTIFRRNTIEEL